MSENPLIYEDDEVRITHWPASNFYEIESKSMQLQRSGKGILMLSAPAMRKLGHAIQERVW